MRSALISAATFLIPFVFFGNHVGRHVAKHLAAGANYSTADVDLGYKCFFLFAGIMAGLACLALTKILASRKRDKLVSFGVVLLPLLFGYFIADVTLYGFYERKLYTGPVTEWLTWTASAFLLTGALPSCIFFGLIQLSSKPTTLADAS